MRKRDKERQNKPMSSNLCATPEASSLYPEVPLIDRSRDCAENFGKCSVEEMEQLLSGKLLEI